MDVCGSGFYPAEALLILTPWLDCATVRRGMRKYERTRRVSIEIISGQYGGTPSCLLWNIVLRGDTERVEGILRTEIGREKIVCGTARTTVAKASPSVPGRITFCIQLAKIVEGNDIRTLP